MRLKHEFGTTTLLSAEFDTDTGTVVVNFVGGSKTYAGFTAEEFDEWCQSEKPAPWFNNRVRQRPKAHPEVAADAPVGVQPFEAPPVEASLVAADPTPTPVAAPPATGMRARLKRCLARWNGKE